MDISLTSLTLSQTFSQEKKQNDLGIKNLYTQKVEGDELKQLKQQVVDNAHAFTFSIEIIQINITTNSQENDEFLQTYKEFQQLLDDIGYKGKNIADLSQDEAKELVSEDGFFGIKQTSQRIAEFVIKGANGNEELLKSGLEGVKRGFKEAEEMWGGKLPDISYETIKQAKELIQQEMAKLGYSVLDTKV